MSLDRLATKIDLNLINPKNQLLKSQIYSDLLIYLRSKITEYPATHDLKQCSEFLLYVCKIVEELIVKSDKVNKRDMVVDLFKALFSLSELEAKALGVNIDFLWSNQLIQKIKVTKKSIGFFKKQLSKLL